MIRISLGLSLIFICLLISHPQALAAKGGKAGNLKFEGSLGIPNVGIENPDGSSAYYDGLSLMGRIIAPVYGKNQFWVSLVANLRYMDLENTANNDNQKEFASQLGPGLGLRFNVGRIFLGLDYFVIRNRHYAFGGISKELEYNSSPMSYYIGMEFPLGSLSLGINYAMSTGTIAVDDTKLAEAAPYTDSVAMVTLTWDSGVSFGKFASGLVKK